MRSAPAVTVDLPDDLLWRGLETLLRALAAVALWWVVFGPVVDAAAAAAGTVAAVLAGGSRWWRLPATSRLLWDGKAWQLDGLPGRARIVADLGAWLLLRFDAAAGRSTWFGVWLSRQGIPGPALRRALVAHGQEAPEGGLPPPET